MQLITQFYNLELSNTSFFFNFYLVCSLISDYRSMSLETVDTETFNSLAICFKVALAFIDEMLYRYGLKNKTYKYSL
jgi:hypothetical protein